MIKIVQEMFRRPVADDQDLDLQYVGVNDLPRPFADDLDRDLPHLQIPMVGADDQDLPLLFADDQNLPLLFADDIDPDLPLFAEDPDLRINLGVEIDPKLLMSGKEIKYIQLSR
eukprot:TRINITY_DN1704_c0_g1_i2.p2 TRINITY_DN1704_c0_g1~~TRINITY_DN1704_c0_g1_i2.p2  ORF type:complete len:114 (+),score=7.83 TRINITY_DN1704_c0_g1_i2:254-595(+)